MSETSPVTENKMNILAVDDEPSSLNLLEIMLTRDQYNVETAVNGKLALDILYQRPDDIDIILLDRMMPQMNGIEVCEVLKSDNKLRHIPIIMQTAANKPEEISEGIEAGVFYYLTKPLVRDTLLSVVSSAAKQVRQHRMLRKEMHQQKSTFGLVQVLKCTYKTLEEVTGLSSFLAKLFPDPDTAITGISELLINAVEHGNLNITYEEKSRLVSDNAWDDEIQRRLADPKYADKSVAVIFERKKEDYYLQITDDGDGFDWKQFLQIDPSRAMHNHGRGIAMANMLSFDRLIYNEKGNQVTGIVALKEEERDDFWG